jgi:hypothetical protein
MLAVLAWKAGIKPQRGIPHQVNGHIQSEPVEPLPKPEIKRPAEELLTYMNPVILDALALGRQTTSNERLDLLHAINEKLTEDECLLLLHELRKRRAKSTPEGWYSEYMHEICCLLGRQDATKQEYAGILADIASDPQRDEVIRDYALQHLRLLWESADSHLRRKIVLSLEVLARDESPISASSMLSLHLLGSPSNANAVSESGASQIPKDSRAFELPNERIEPLVSKVMACGPTNVSVVSRMTAVRIVRERGMRSCLPLLRKMASDSGAEHAVVRMAAISALGALGNSSDIAFLNTLDRRDARIDAVIRHIKSATP